jgi:DNA-binding NarL/FixJ family response regulator
MKLLLVDDEDAVRSRMAEAFSEINDIEVFSCAPHVAGNLQRMLKEQPDVVVIDIRMDGDALDLVRSIKSNSHSPVVIALSSPSSLQYRIACQKAGAEFFFDKVREQARLMEAVVELKIELGC